MFPIFICCLFASTAYSAPQHYQPQLHTGKPVIPIVAESNEINPDGSFNYSYTSGDGQQAQAQGYLKDPGNKDKEAEVIQGSYSYTAPDGTPITVTYIADEFGFRAEGAHLPTPPPIPEAIQQSLKLIAQSQKQPQRQNPYPRNTFPQSSYKPNYPRSFRY